MLQHNIRKNGLWLGIYLIMKRVIDPSRACVSELQRKLASLKGTIDTAQLVLGVTTYFHPTQTTQPTHPPTKHTEPLRTLTCKLGSQFYATLRGVT